MGISTILKNGMEKDYILIKYKGDDKLYLPVSNLDKLYKYSSKDGARPVIHKLNSTEWQKTKMKIRNKIKDEGFIISIDDFGTGYSSLSMLQSMPIDIIKIDKVFVDKANLTSDKNIINYIIILAKRLGVETIVEGVETKEQVDFVKRLGCDIIQGYYYSKPISREDFEEYFNKNK